MREQGVYRDERTVSVENASFRWAYLALSFGLLLSTAWRGFVRHEQAWDLLALVVLGGAITTFYQGLRQVLTRRWLMVTLLMIALSVVAGALLVVFVR